MSAAQLTQVLNGSGKYGAGTANPKRLASKVLHAFGSYPCPHLTAQGDGQEVVITADQCKAWSHRKAPTTSPRELLHWQACNGCAHKLATLTPESAP